MKTAISMLAACAVGGVASASTITILHDGPDDLDFVVDWAADVAQGVFGQGESVTVGPVNITDKEGAGALITVLSSSIYLSGLGVPWPPATNPDGTINLVPGYNLAFTAGQGFNPLTSGPWYPDPWFVPPAYYAPESVRSVPGDPYALELVYGPGTEPLGPYVASVGDAGSSWLLLGIGVITLMGLDKARKSS